MATGSDQLLGRVAVAAKMITEDQLSEAVSSQAERNDNSPLGMVLMDLGMIDGDQLQKVLELQKGVIEKQRKKRAAERAAAEAGEAPAVEAAPKPVKKKAAAPQVDVDINGSIEQLLHQAVMAGASDIHIHTSSPLKLRARREVYDHGTLPIELEVAERLIFESFTPEDRAAFDKFGEHDYCYEIEGLGRFRANAYRQLRGIDAVFRFIPPKAPSLEDLGLPSSLAKLTSYHQGMVLLTGPMSCGKSSTMAALVNLINKERTEHILTIEDPIEFVHPSKQCLVNQRSVHRHTESFARALRGALREDPDVIVIGELRDRETIGLALTAAETGHFVLASLHTDNAIRTVNRMVGAFPPDQQDQVRAMLSESLKAVVSQRLVPTADESGMAPALEIMIVNRAVGNLIRENKTLQIHSLLQTGSKQGMCLLDDSLAKLVRDGTITREDALKVCEDAKRIPG